jgi:hypothetical protein
LPYRGVALNRKNNIPLALPREGRIDFDSLTNFNMSDAGDEGVYFIYTRQARADIPRDVIRVRVHPSVRAIKDNAFDGCSQLMIVILGKGLEEIGGGGGILLLHIAT